MMRSKDSQTRKRRISHRRKAVLRQRADNSRVIRSEKRRAIRKDTPPWKVSNV